ncbi:P-loop NTPase fold protein [Flavobacterium sp. ZE23DGlu08]|uniref:P-loop NTPase fold protein n=1 Tax=Flavobacterium sp. ZE23DGlu08 TaxID=3059026 RepID=UPI00265F9303|nr:P-loop NTPase fold protein [Flavobacterium sp. ZE23DGlu08]WKL44120.1 P-loop NTPase fold protein [Flavobacterium sp. ZE23DGlu08]
MNKNSTEIKNYNFIKNQPLGEDLFKNKSQEKTALVISEKIIKDPEFKIIGIDGEWGSGKSNLVRLIENKLEKSHKFFVYDVWGHQEDEQRKSILVELTDFIKNETDLLKKGNEKIWDNKLKFLLAKSKETTTINQPYLSVGFIFSLLSIVYIPTVNVFKDSLKDFFEIDSLFWKIVLVTFPILIVLGIYFWNVIKYWCLKSGFCKAFKLSAEETFQVYTNKQKEETKIETISEDQPSVRDFQNWMEDINNDLNKPIVIVFDNFDRLPKKHIQNIWSSIHIFFAEKKYSNIKVIIPFDREHIQNAFKELNAGDSKFGDDYVNKTFDIVFRVTKPIMSNWKEFFEANWKKAFVNPDEEELKLVVQVYEFLNRRITPREIISFINEILTIKLLDDKFKERYIAIFVLKKDKILNNPLKAVTDIKDIVDGLFHVYANDSEYAKQLTAIVYHIEVDKALELIYTQELKDSMLKNDVEHFNEICNSDFINAMFYSTMLEIDNFENPILTLAAINNESNVSITNIQQTWNLFNNRVLQLDFSITKFQISDWQLALLKNISDDKYLTKLLDGYFNLIDDSNIENYIDLIDDLIIDLKTERVLGYLVKRKISDKNFIKFLEYSGENYGIYKLYTDYKSLDQYLSKLSIEEILKLKNTEFLPEEYDFKSYKAILKNSLNTFIDKNNVQSSNDVLVKLKERSKKNGDMKDLLDDSRIYSLYSSFSSSELPIINELIAMRIAKGSGFNSAYVSQFTSILSLNDDKRAEAISEIILKYIEYGELLLLSKHFNSSPLFKQIILKMFNKTDLGKSANIIPLIENYDEIKGGLGIDDNLLINEFNKWEVDKNKLDINKLSDLFINDCLNSSDLRISKDLFEVFNMEFKNLDNEAYGTVFDDGTDVHFKYFKHLEFDNLSQTSLDVFGNKLIEKLKSNKAIDNNNWDILAIYDSNHSTISIINTLKNILSEIFTSKIEFKIDSAKKLIPYFIKYDLLKNHNDIFRLVIKNDFLSDSEFVTLLISNSEYLKNIYKNAIQSDKDGFRNLINQKREDNSEFESLAKSLDLRKSKSNSEEN